MEFYTGQKFEGQYPPEAAIWCNENNAYIKYIEDTTRLIDNDIYDDDGNITGTEKIPVIIPVYEIVENEKSSEEEIKQRAISDLEKQIEDINTKQIRDMAIMTAYPENSDEYIEAKSYFLKKQSDKEALIAQINKLKEEQ